MADSLLQALWKKMGGVLPEEGPKPTDAQRKLYEEMARRNQGPAAKVIDAAGQFTSGLFADPLMPQEELTASSPWKKGGMLLAAAPIGAPKGLFSRVEREVAKFPKRINANRAINQLKNTTSAEERSWRGVDTMLKEQGGKAIETELIKKHLDKNPLNVKVIEKEDNPDFVKTFKERDSNGTQYSGYQMPKATNYRETLIQLDKPGARGNLQSLTDDLARGMGENTQDFQSHHWDEPNVLVHTRHNERRLPPVKEAEDVFDIASATDAGYAPFQGSARAWNLTPREGGNEFVGYGNSAAEAAQDAYDARFGSTNAAGNKGPLGRMLENVQSDWHQRGAHSGYTSENPRFVTDPQGGVVMHPNMLAARNRMRDNNLEALAYIEEAMPENMRLSVDPEWDVEETAHNLDAYLRYYAVPGPHASSAVTERLRDMHERLRDSRRSYDEINDALARNSGAVPDAPFKDSWAELALKQQLLDVADRPDINWIGIAPSSELRARGEVISPKFQDEQLPNTLEKLLKPFGGSVEKVDIMEKGKPFFNPSAETNATVGVGDKQWAQVSRYLHGDDENPIPIASTWPAKPTLAHPGYTGPVMEINPDREAKDLINLLTQNRPDLLRPEMVQAFIARLSPEMKEEIKKKGFPLLAALIAAEMNRQGVDNQR